MFEIKLHAELTRLGFDWVCGVVYLQHEDKPPVCITDGSDLELHVEYSSCGNKGFPRFLAIDARAVYFATYEEHMLHIERIIHDVEHYRRGGKIPHTFPNWDLDR